MREAPAPDVGRVVEERAAVRRDDTIREANNYAHSLLGLQRFEEVKSLLRKVTPVARRILGEEDRLTIKMRWNYADALYKDDDAATLDDVREAVTTLEDLERIV